MARRKRHQRFASQAALEALVRFGPEQSGLRAMERGARSTYTHTVRSARGAAEGIIGEVNRSLPETRRTYVQAGLDAARAAHGIVDPAIANLGPEAASLRAAVGIEQGGLQSRLAADRAAAMTDLRGRRVQARQGALFAESSARSDLTESLAKIFERSQDLRRERGAFQAATIGNLEEAARERAQQFAIAEGRNRQSNRNARRTARQQERNSQRSAGLDPDTGKPIKGGPLDPHSPRYRGKGGGGGPGGQGWASQAQHAAAQDAISEAQRWAKQLKGAGLPRADVAAALSSGRSEVQKHDPQTGKPLFDDAGNPVMRRAIPQIKSQLLLSAALDEIYDGHLSRQNTRRLHARRLRIRDLPVTSYQSWRRNALNYEKRTGRPKLG